ncbi:MAG: hypothetical protein JSU07_12630 [Bacteroidetes bacterium]|nr:hypothetical protein [Bacteroidota bacterium]
MQKTHIAENNFETNTLSKKQKERVKWLLILFLVIGFVIAAFSQNATSNETYTTLSTFEPSIKNAIKFTDLPEIIDTVKKINSIKYGINSQPLFPKYNVTKIEQAKLQNEPLPKIYHSLLKAGYGPIYNMPYGEFWISNARSRDMSYGAHLKHFSSTTHLENVGYGGFSDNQANIFAKKFYKKHTLTGDFNYERNVIHYYGYDTSINKVSNDYTKQIYNFFNPTVRLKSHYSDSTHINHDIKTSYYNFFNAFGEKENNIRLNADGQKFINKERVSLGLLADYYNLKQKTDTLNNLIVSVSPKWEANGKQTNVFIEFTPTLDNFYNTNKFYFYPKFQASYDIYQSIIIPYAGLNGGLIKNSFRNFMLENPFIDTTIKYKNTNNQINAYLGLKGSLSENTSYDVKASYSTYNNMYFYTINYNDLNLFYNRFSVVYDDATLLNVNGQLKYNFKEKLNFMLKGNYYLWHTKTLTRAYMKPDFDFTLSGVYNIQSKILVRADVFVLGNQWALSKSNQTNALVPKTINAWVDANLEVEYRYSKMLSFFARFSNIANQRYYRWDRYPSQRFNAMIGVTFVPF